MGRAPCCEKEKVKKGAWSTEEDNILVKYISKHGHGTWRSLPKLAGLRRCGKSCRLRWANYLRPDIKRGPFTHEEENTIIQLHSLFGNKWAAISAQLNGRTDNEVKNYWNSHLKKRSVFANNNTKSINLKSSEPPSTSHLAQWESARVEAEARMASKQLLLVETKYDHFLNLWSSNVGQSFRNVTFGHTNHVEEEILVGSDYSNSCELDDCSDSALKMWLDFPSGNDMGFLEGQTDNDVAGFF